MTTVLIIGASRGLGLATARACAARGAQVLAGSRDGSGSSPSGSQSVALDLMDLRSVRRIASGLPHVDVLICNAGVQITRPAPLTKDGFERSLQVNVLAHLQLIDLLNDRSQPPRSVVFIGSQTHDPRIPTGTPEPDERPLTSWQDQDPLKFTRMDGVRRYATTKLLVTALTGALAREHPHSRYVCFDPGMMPGTGLARDRAAATRLLWSTLMLGLRVLPFASSPSRSAAQLAALMLDERSGDARQVPRSSGSGIYVDFRGRDFVPSDRARDLRYQDRVLRDARTVLGHGRDSRLD